MGFNSLASICASAISAVVIICGEKVVDFLSVFIGLRPYQIQTQMRQHYPQ